MRKHPLRKNGTTSAGKGGGGRGGGGFVRKSRQGSSGHHIPPIQRKYSKKKNPSAVEILAQRPGTRTKTSVAGEEKTIRSRERSPARFCGGIEGLLESLRSLPRKERVPGEKFLPEMQGQDAYDGGSLLGQQK